jgi:hypothetical protein
MLCCTAIYGIYYAVIAIMKKISNKTKKQEVIKDAE